MTIKRIISSTLAMLFALTFAAAQMEMPQIPTDPELRIGKLENGMTYYIRHNEKPADMAEFYIFHNVGAIQEEDSQIGLAHFLEHMAFNGTTNLPDKELITYLETVGVKFGANLNAGTGVEMTYYMMSQVPVKREAVVDSVLLILHDWSHFIALEGDEIDNERGVIIEELRGMNSGNFRIQQRIMPVIYNGNKYGYRNIIGNEEQLRNFSHQEIRDFYHRWYRPDLQAVIIVGDIDVDVIEAKLKVLMSDIPPVENAEEKEYYPIPDNDEPLVAIETDREVTSSSASLLIKRQAFPFEMNDKLSTYYFNTALGSAISMLNNRFSEITQEPGAPFLGASISNDALSFTNAAISGGVGAREGELETAFAAFLAEIERAKRYGFTESEFERWKTNVLRNAELSYERRGDRRSDSFIWTYINNFRTNNAMPSAETSWELAQQVLNDLTVEMVNELFAAMITDHNQVVIVTMPEKEGLEVPTKEAILDIIYASRTAEIAGYEDQTIDEPLITAEIKPGKVKKSEEGVFGSTVWTLSNGMKVVLKQTDFSKNQVSMSAYADGGFSTVSDEDYRTATILGDLVGMSGVGNFANNDLRKVLTGKAASAGPSFGRFSTGFSGGASTKDVETMLQLTYLYFTQPRFDSKDFDRMMDMVQSSLKNAENTPNFKLSEETSKTLYGDHIRAQQLKLENLSDIDYEKMPALYDKFYKGQAGNYIFFFVGDFDMDEIKPLIEKYLGGLPTKGKKIKRQDDGLQIRRGEIDNRFRTQMEAPKTNVSYIYTGDIEYNQENNMIMSFLNDCLNTRYTASIREEKGGTYGVQVRGSLSRLPKETYTLQVSFQTDPDLVDELLYLVDEEIEKIAENGPLADDMGKAMEHRLKTRPESLKNNGTWMNYLSTYYVWGEDWNTNYDSMLESMTAEKVQALARKILDDGNVIRIIMDPER